MENWKTTHLACAALFAILSFILGILIGYFSRRTSFEDPDAVIKKLSREADLSITDKIVDSIDNDYIDEILRTFSQKPALAGTPRQRYLADYVNAKWREQGLKTEIVTYNVLLSYPKANHNNTVSLLDSNGQVVFTSSATERKLYDEVASQDIVQPFNAYSPSGLIEGDLVYANYGRRGDFERLKLEGIDVTGKIVIARYAKIFRGNKVLFAEEAGAAGVILFSDPDDYTGTPFNASGVYPEQWWLPGSGVQRGNVVLYKGDQSTPGYPSTKDAYRLSEGEINKKLPSIPCHPIGYEDAYHILKSMDGPSAWSDWQGGLNFTYRLQSTGNTSKVRLDVQNENVYRPIHNVIGTIEGSIEPDRVVLMGAHRDAWVYGGIDPNTGGVTLMETTRILAQLVKYGWRPRRTLMVCSWDGEEYGLVGSYEWVEENIKWLRERGVAYINSDSSVTGNYTFLSKAVPLLHSAIYKAAQRVPAIEYNFTTLYDSWKSKTMSDPPKISAVGSGSDHTPFIANAGIVSAYSKYYSLENKQWTGSSGPLYHTRYESYRLFRMIDPEFKVAGAVVAFHSELMRDLLDARILPLDPQVYADVIRQSVEALTEQFNKTFRAKGVYLDTIVSSMENFSCAVDKFHQNLSQVDVNNPLEVRRYNDKLMGLEGVFIDDQGLPERPRYKHLLHSPSSSNHYGGTGFPGLEDLVFSAEKEPANWERVKSHVATIAFTLQAAANFLHS